MTKQLIIIGNGFDLACGLKSSYKDFFEDIFKERLETGDNEIGEVDNFWMEYFFQTKNITENRDIIWKDIESSIDNCVSYVSKYYQGEEYFRTSGRNTDFARIIKKRKNIDIVKPEVYNELTRDEIFKQLYEDLENFEKKFVEYLNKEIRKNDYSLNTKKLIDYLITNSNQINNNDNYETEILSFNYTNEFNNNNESYNYNVTNIHGKLETGDIIFGIDSKHVNDNTLVDFTKNFRILFSNDNYPFILDKKLEEIKFYGHSLNEADFTHFKSIFDKVNLKNSNVRLIFYFSIYGDKTEQELKRENIKTIKNFLEKYEESIQAENLFNTLISENRLHVRKIDITKVLS